MNVSHAKETLIDTCAEDFVSTMSSTKELYEIARKGFVGFDSLTLGDLIQATEDAGLHVEDDEVQEAIDVITRHLAGL